MNLYITHLYIYRYYKFITLPVLGMFPPGNLLQYNIWLPLKYYLMNKRKTIFTLKKYKIKTPWVSTTKAIIYICIGILCMYITRSYKISLGLSIIVNAFASVSSVSTCATICKRTLCVLLRYNMGIILQFSTSQNVDGLRHIWLALKFLKRVSGCCSIW